MKYICIAVCSKECQIGNENIFTTNYCKQLKTYNNCEECDIYVCKECYIELKKNNINYCLICRKAIEDIENFKIQEIKKKHVKYIVINLKLI